MKLAPSAGDMIRPFKEDTSDLVILALLGSALLFLRGNS
jgi:hypothetical protein